MRAIKAHATGTPGNDAAEGQALNALFADQPPPVAALKPQLGYGLGAGGLLELVAWLGCLELGRLPAVAGFAETDPECGIEPLREVAADQLPRAAALHKVDIDCRAMID